MRALSGVFLAAGGNATLKAALLAVPGGEVNAFGRNGTGSGFALGFGTGFSGHGGFLRRIQKTQLSVETAKPLGPARLTSIFSTVGLGIHPLGRRWLLILSNQTHLDLAPFDFAGVELGHGCQGDVALHCHVAGEIVDADFADLLTRKASLGCQSA